ncbi:MAG: hypothetical protein LC708_00705, partial [Actinobacteria bacterium]|nr:hypothetical protein [Actinomycetota bacterium]
GRGHPGLYLGGVGQGSRGALVTDANAAASFDGVNDTVEVPSSPDVDFDRTATFSLEAWFKTTMAGAGMLLAKMNNAVPFRGYDLWSANGSVVFQLISDYGAGNYLEVYGGAGLNNGSWHHVVASSNGSSTAAGITMYVDGTAAALTTNKDTLTGTTLSSTPLELGSRYPGAYVLAGSLDEAAVYPSALSAARAQAHYASGTSGSSGSSTAYYADNDPQPNPCDTSAPMANQAGRAKTTTRPDPDGPGPGAAMVEESVYDAAGRVVASRYNAEAWRCTSYDQRGRVLVRSFPANGAEAARSVSYNYAVSGPSPLNPGQSVNNPLVTSVSDAAGPLSSTVDLLGRVVSYTDAWGKTTTSSYDQAGRLITTDGPGGRRDTDYDPAGRPTAQRLADQGSLLPGPALASPSYDAAGELATVAYANATALASLTKNPAGALTGPSWSAAGGAALATDTVSRSQSGRVMDESIDGVDANPAGANFSYDGAGRLKTAVVAGYSLAYNFADSGNCGYGANAGRGSNR